MAPPSNKPATPPVTRPVSPRIAVLGEHSARARAAVHAFLQQFGLEAAGQREPAQTGKELYLDRLDGLRDLQYAVVVLPATALDPSSGQPKACAPELLMELGYVLGTLGRNRVIFLVSGEAKVPAWQGIANLRMDDDGLWHLLLARAMKQAGLDVDLNRAV
jgi:predicted nucleotide-binding protein